jgi:hypothetical protein
MSVAAALVACVAIDRLNESAGERDIPFPVPGASVLQLPVVNTVA